MRLLLVEDNVALADELDAMLARSGYAVDWRSDGRDALTQALLEPYDAIVLDLELPGRHGLEVLRAWRDKGLSTPVLILTAHASWAERIEGLRAGADDYLAKPFHPEELRLRLQALLRRVHGHANEPLLRAGGLSLDERTQRARTATQETELTAAEFRLLRYLMLHAGHIVSRIQLAEHLYDAETEHDSNVVEVYINRLRRKLGAGIIETRRGQGYRFIGFADGEKPGAGS